MFITSTMAVEYLLETSGHIIAAYIPCRVGLVVSMSASHIVQTASLHGTQCIRVGSFAVQPDCLKGRLVCGTVYGDMHLKDLLHSIVSVGYHMPVLDFYLVLHGLCC